VISSEFGEYIVVAAVFRLHKKENREPVWFIRNIPSLSVRGYFLSRIPRKKLYKITICGIRNQKAKVRYGS